MSIAYKNVTPGWYIVTAFEGYEKLDVVEVRPSGNVYRNGDDCPWSVKNFTFACKLHLEEIIKTGKVML